MSQTRGKTTPASTNGSYAAHTGPRSRTEPAGPLTPDTVARRSRELAGDRFTAGELAEQFYVTRLVDRVFTQPSDDDGVEWLLKGGMRQLAAARSGRHTSDADLYTDLPISEAIASLRARVEQDLGDGIEYRLRSAVPYDHHPDAAKVEFDIFVDGKPAGISEVDVSTTIRTTCPPRTVDPYDPLKIDLPRPAKWRAYHPADQLADKVAATFETVAGRPSQRFRDLVDIVLIASTQGVRAGELRTAISTEMAARGMLTPAQFDVPDHGAWSNGYEREAAMLPELRNQGFARSLAAAKRFLDPVMSGTVDPTWRWDRLAQTWKPLDH